MTAPLPGLGPLPHLHRQRCFRAALSEPAHTTTTRRRGGWSTPSSPTARRYLAEEGLLVFIVPTKRRLHVSARYLASHYGTH